MAPSLRWSCSKAEWCSCRDCGAPSHRPSVPSWTTHKGEKGRCSCPSRPRIPESEHRGRRILSPSKRLFATRPVPAPPQSFFSREAHTLHKPPQGGFAEALAGHRSQEVASLADGGCGSRAYILLEELPCELVRFGGSSASLPWGKGLSSRSESGVALDRGEADAEKAGCLGLGRAVLLECLDYLLSQVFGVGSHHPMIDHVPCLGQ